MREDLEGVKDNFNVLVEELQKRDRKVDKDFKTLQRQTDRHREDLNKGEDERRWLRESLETLEAKVHRWSSPMYEDD